MLFAIMATDHPDTLAQRLANRPAHLERLEMLQAAGKLILAGPFPAPDAQGFTGSLIVADFESLLAAQEWASLDPYQLAGVYVHIHIKPFKQVFPK